MSNLRSGEDIFDLELFIPGNLIRCTNLYPLMYRSFVDAATIAKHWNPGYVSYCEKQRKERLSFLSHAKGEVLGGAPQLPPIVGSAASVKPSVPYHTSCVASTAPPAAAASTATAVTADALAHAAARHAAASAEAAATCARTACFWSRAAQGLADPMGPYVGSSAALATSTAARLAAGDAKVPADGAMQDHLDRPSFLTSEDFLAGQPVSWIKNGDILQILGALYSEEGLPMVKVLAPSSENPEEMQIGWICLHPSMQLEFMM